MAESEKLNSVDNNRSFRTLRIAHMVNLCMIKVIKSLNTHPYKLLFKLCEREVRQCHVRSIRANEEGNEDSRMKDGWKTRLSLFLKTPARE